MLYQREAVLGGMTPAYYRFRGRAGELRIGLWIFRRRLFQRYEPRGRYVCDVSIPGPLDPHARAILRNRARVPNRCASEWARRANAVRRSLLILAERPR